MSETATEEEYVDNNDVPGQLVFPEQEVDAERAGAFVAGKVDTLYDEEEDEEAADEEADE